MLELQLPRSLGVANTLALFRLAGQIKAAPQGELSLDASMVEFVDPLGLAVLGAVLEPQMLAGRKVCMPWLPPAVTSYLDRMNFFGRCPVEGPDIAKRERHDRRASLVELTCIRDPWDADSAAQRLSYAITGELTDADPEAPPLDEASGQNQFARYNHPLQYALTELLNNALTHARREGCTDAAVWVAAQYYRVPGRVRLAVVDNGCGILETLRWHPQLPAPTHTAAITTALLPRVSCNRDLQTRSDSINQGVGLTTTFRIARAAQGGLAIVSGDGYHSAAGQTMRMPAPAQWQGVAVALELRRDRLPEVRVRQLLPGLDGPAVALRFEN